MRKRVVALVMTIVLVLSMSVAALADPTKPAIPMAYRPAPVLPSSISLPSCPASGTVDETYVCPTYYENMP